MACGSVLVELWKSGRCYNRNAPAAFRLIWKHWQKRFCLESVSGWAALPWSKIGCLWGGFSCGAPDRHPPPCSGDMSGGYDATAGQRGAGEGHHSKWNFLACFNASHFCGKRIRELRTNEATLHYRFSLILIHCKGTLKRGSDAKSWNEVTAVRAVEASKKKKERIYEMC